MHFLFDIFNITKLFMKHWKPSLFKLAFDLFGFSTPFMKNKKTCYLSCGRGLPKTNWKDTMIKKKFSLAYFIHREQLSICFQSIR